MGLSLSITLGMCCGGTLLQHVMSTVSHVNCSILTADCNKEVYGEGLSSCRDSCGSKNVYKMAEVLSSAGDLVYTICPLITAVPSERMNSVEKKT